MQADTRGAGIPAHTAGGDNNNPNEKEIEMSKTKQAPGADDLTMLAVQFAQQLCVRYGIATLFDVDEANSRLPEQDDAVHDFIDPAGFEEEYKSSCDALGVDENDPAWRESIQVVRENGYATYGDNYGPE